MSPPRVSLNMWGVGEGSSSSAGVSLRFLSFSEHVGPKAWIQSTKVVNLLSLSKHYTTKTLHTRIPTGSASYMRSEYHPHSLHILSFRQIMFVCMFVFDNKSLHILDEKKKNTPAVRSRIS